jgi:hypothetical protein
MKISGKGFNILYNASEDNIEIFNDKSPCESYTNKNYKDFEKKGPPKISSKMFVKKKINDLEDDIKKDVQETILEKMKNDINNSKVKIEEVKENELINNYKNNMVPFVGNGNIVHFPKSDLKERQGGDRANNYNGDVTMLGNSGNMANIPENINIPFNGNMANIPENINNILNGNMVNKPEIINNIPNGNNPFNANIMNFPNNKDMKDMLPIVNNNYLMMENNYLNTQSCVAGSAFNIYSNSKDMKEIFPEKLNNYYFVNEDKYHGNFYNDTISSVINPTNNCPTYGTSCYRGGNIIPNIIPNNIPSNNQDFESMEESYGYERSDYFFDADQMPNEDIYSSSSSYQHYGAYEGAGYH